MNQCDAVVVEISGDEVCVEVSGREAACGHCKNADACQDGLSGSLGGSRRYRLENSINARVGDHVQLTVADGTVWRASLASYVFPVALVIGGAGIGQSVAGDVWAIMGALAGLGCGFIILRRNELSERRRGSPFSLHVQTKEVRFKESS